MRPTKETMLKILGNYLLLSHSKPEVKVLLYIINKTYEEIDWVDITGRKFSPIIKLEGSATYRALRKLKKEKEIISIRIAENNFYTNKALPDMKVIIEKIQQQFPHIPIRKALLTFSSELQEIIIKIVENSVFLQVKEDK